MGNKCKIVTNIDYNYVDIFGTKEDYIKTANADIYLQNAQITSKFQPLKIIQMVCNTINYPNHTECNSCQKLLHFVACQQS